MLALASTMGCGQDQEVPHLRLIHTKQESLRTGSSWVKINNLICADRQTDETAPIFISFFNNLLSSPAWEMAALDTTTLAFEELF